LKALAVDRRFIGFLIAGVVSTLCNLGSRYGFQLWMPYEWALVGANTVGVLTAFAMNRVLVFRSRSARVWGELARFVAVNLVGIAVSWGVAVLLYRSLLPAIGFDWHPDLVAHAVGIAVPLLPNYLAHKWWTFSRPPPEGDKPRT
jgi:putative flippase GtrA